MALPITQTPPVTALGDTGVITQLVGPLVVITSGANYFFQYFPIFLTSIAAFLVIILYSLQIWRDSAIQHFVRNWQMKKKAKKIRKIKARQMKLTAQLEALELVKQARHDARVLVEHAAVAAQKLVVDETAQELIKSTPPT